jgi:hypothetical protein
LTCKDNWEHLPHLWEPPPDPESRSPATWEDHGAQEKDRLASAIECANTPNSQNIQPRICERCGNTFEPRKNSGGKPQRFCSPQCRKSIVPNAKPNAESAPSVGEVVGKDLGKDVGQDIGDEDIVVPEQLKIEVYFKRLGDVVIMQEASHGPYVRVRPENLPFLIRRLQEIESNSGPF